MDPRAALTYMFRGRRSLAMLARVGLLTIVPVLGQLIAYALMIDVLRWQALEPRHDESLGPFADRDPIWSEIARGFRAVAVVVLCGIGASLIGAILLVLSPPVFDGASPLLVEALASPSNAVIALMTATLTSLCLVRFALTDSLLETFRPNAIWRLLSAEPSLWVTTGLVGTLFVEGPRAMIWLAPWGDSTKAVVTLMATALLWPWALLVQARLISDAHAASTATRRARQGAVRLRW